MITWKGFASSAPQLIIFWVKELYDIVSDVHGFAAELGTLIDKLDYTQDAEVFHHPRAWTQNL